jgi:hypothetical protein
MTNYADSAISKVRDFLWSNMVEDRILEPNDYIADGFSKLLVPIIPTQQVPEFNNLIGNKTYIVYDFDISSYTDQWWICEETALFSIISNDFSKILEITNYMVDLFRRLDDVGQEINKSLPSTTKFKFYYVSLESATSPSPYMEEGGRQIGQIGIKYEYSRLLNSNGRFQ